MLGSIKNRIINPDYSKKKVLENVESEGVHKRKGLVNKIKRIIESDKKY